MKINTAGLTVQLEPKYELLKTRVKDYICEDDKEADIVIELSEKFYEDRQKENPHLSLAECEYIWTASYFYGMLTRFSGMMLHASCVEYEGNAYLFSAPSGTGKSTHTHLWLKYLPGSRIINDDKPALRIIDSRVYAFGTPWSGKTDENVNVGVPVGGIAFLSRGENKIERVPGASVLKSFMDQTVRPVEKELMSALFDVTDCVLSTVPVYRFSCDISKEAVETAVREMKRGALH